MSFYIENFMPGTSDTPSVVVITLPDNSQFKALLASEVSIQLSNKFGALIPGVEMLTDIAQVMGGTNLPAWIGASTQGWRGTDPVRFNLETYLINYKPKLNYEEALKKLVKLASISPSEGSMGGAGHLAIKVHGGYSPDVFASNKWQFIDNQSLEILNKDGNMQSAAEYFDDRQIALLGSMNMAGEVQLKGADNAGTLTVQIGNRFRLNNILLTNISVTPSVVEVYSPSAGEQPKPLYYRVSMSLMTCRSALATDVDKMFR